MDTRLALELFGYLGTALVLLSFLLTDIKWLRVANMAGSLVSLTYAICVNTMPVAVLNASLLAINAFQLARIISNEKKAKEVTSPDSTAYTQIDKEKEEKI